MCKDLFLSHDWLLLFFFVAVVFKVDELQASLEDDQMEEKTIGGAILQSGGRPSRDGNRQSGDENLGNGGLGPTDRTAGKGGPSSMDVDAPSS